MIFLCCKVSNNRSNNKILCLFFAKMKKKNELHLVWERKSIFFEVSLLSVVALFDNPVITERS